MNNYRFAISVYSIWVLMTVTYALDRLVYMCFNTIWFERLHGSNIVSIKRDVDVRRRKKALEKYKKDEPEVYARIRKLVD